MQDQMVRLTRLQEQWASHVGEAARAAATQFLTRVRASDFQGRTPEELLRIYELWTDCAEQAWGAAIRTDAFCRLPSELMNATHALILEHRKLIEGVTSAFGIPTRAEVDLLHRRVEELQAELRSLRTRQAGVPDSRNPSGVRSRTNTMSADARRPAEAPANKRARSRSNAGAPSAQAAELTRWCTISTS
jgi:hypothetical protein